jgi:hypothetical protein
VAVGIVVVGIAAAAAAMTAATTDGGETTTDAEGMTTGIVDTTGTVTTEYRFTTHPTRPPPPRA